MRKNLNQGIAFLNVIALSFLLSVCLYAEEADFDDMPQSLMTSEVPDSAAELMNQCLARMPDEHISMTGWIMMRQPKGLDSKEFDFTSEIDFDSPIPTAKYTVAKRGGDVIETVLISHDNSGSKITRTLGKELSQSDSPAWNSKIQDTDVTWLDVSLAFLWWKNPKLCGEEKVKGRICDIVELEPPIEVPGCSKVRVWIDREVKMLLKAAEISEDGCENRLLWIRSVKKMNNKWMVRDIEVQGRGTSRRTRIHVQSIESSPSME